MNPKIPNSMSESNDEIAGSKASISGDLLAALERVASARIEVGTRIKAAVEEICRDAEKLGVLPIVEVKTSPEIVCGGFPRNVQAHVTVEFRLRR